MTRSASGTTKTWPSPSAASSCTGSPPSAPGADRTASSRSIAARANRSAPSPVRVEAITSPERRAITAASIWAEISVRSARACWASIAVADATTAHTPLRAKAVRQVLSRPRHAPRGDDRVLRAPVVRAARLPLAGAPRLLPPRRRLGLLRARARPRVPLELARDDPARRPRDPGQRGDARDHRRDLPALVVPVALQRPRVGVQHRLRPAEPVVPAREGHRGGADGRVGRDAL